MHRIIWRRWYTGRWRVAVAFGTARRGLGWATVKCTWPLTFGCVIRDSKLDSWIDCCWIALKWIHSLVDASHFAEFCEKQPITVWEMLINLLKCPILQWWKTWTGRPHNTKFQWNRLIIFAVILLKDRHTKTHNYHIQNRKYNLLQLPLAEVISVHYDSTDMSLCRLFILFTDW